MRKPITFLILCLILVGCNLSNEQTNPIPSDTPIPISTSIATFRTDTPVPSNTPVITRTPLPSNIESDDLCTVRQDWQTYTVVSGDTLSRVARGANTTVQVLIDGNCLEDANLLKVGQVLRVPNAVAPSTIVPPTATSTPMLICTYETEITLPLYATQGFIYQIEDVRPEWVYHISEQSQFAYHVSLPGTNISGWVQKDLAMTEGTCNDIPLVELSMPAQMGTIKTDICYFVTSKKANSYLEQSADEVIGTIPAQMMHRIDARTPDLARIIGATYIGYPVWVKFTDGQIYGNCNEIPNLSIDLTLNGPRETLESSAGGFAFDYPANWPVAFNMDGLPGGRLGTIPFYAASYPGAMPWPEEVVTVEWIVRMDILEEDSDPESFAQEQVAEISGRGDRIEITQDVELFVTSGGIQTWHYQSSGVYAPTDVYVFRVGEPLVIIWITGNNDYADPIIDSLRSQ